MNHIYIVLIKAHTGLGKLAKKITGYDYTHIAVCLDRSFTDFVTYSRRRHYLPLDAGFMHEYRDYYAYGRYERVRIKAFEIPVSDNHYYDVTAFIRQCENDKEQIFNLFSMITMPIAHGFEIYKAHNCMSFTAKVIKLSCAVKMEKPYYKYSIKDMDTLLSDYKFFEGFLKRKNSQNYAKYMQKPPLSEYVKVSADTLLTLAKRTLQSSRIEG